MTAAEVDQVLAHIRAQMDLDSETEHEVLEEIRSHLEEAVAPPTPSSPPGCRWCAPWCCAGWSSPPTAPPWDGRSSSAALPYGLSPWRRCSSRCSSSSAGAMP